MTRKQALTVLHLGAEATDADVEKAYLRLVRRFPPEFHPDRFRQIDEAYRFLTSWSYRLERLLTPEKFAPAELGSFPWGLQAPALEAVDLQQAWRRQLLRSHLFAATPPAVEPKPSRGRRQ